MASDGSAIVRLQRALANERCSAAQIRALVAELPGPVGLEDALAILLALLEREPDTFSRAAARWGGRLVLERKLTLGDAQLRVPVAIRPDVAVIVRLTDEFCELQLDEEYRELCRRLVARSARKRPSPLVRGEVTMKGGRGGVHGRLAELPLRPLSDTEPRAATPSATSPSATH